MKTQTPLPPKQYRLPDAKKRRRRVRLALAGSVLWTALGAGAYEIRPLALLHAPLLYWYTQPIALVVPLLAAAGAALWQWRRSMGHWWLTFAWFVGAGFVVWMFVGFWSHVQMEKAIYRNAAFVEVQRLPQRVAVPVLPRLVADQMVQSAVGVSGYTTRAGHGVLYRKTGRLAWSYELAPGTFFNKLFRPSRGIIQLDAEQTSRAETHRDRTFAHAPGMHISENTTWQILKRHFFSQPTDPVPVVTSSGEPLFVVPYLSFKGFLIRHPVIGGVMVFHPDGRIEDLSPDEAMRRPEIVASGRLFPQTLARRVQESYRFKRGALNTLVGHTDQTEIDDGTPGGNEMPYLMAFHEGAHTQLKWVSAAEPYGRAFATKAIFLTDAITGRTEVWRAPAHADLTGPARSIQTVRSLPGIVWTNFDVVEPRPAFIKGRLQYMLSVVPASPTANTVSKTVFVDAATNKIAAVFNHDDPAVDADAQVAAYLQTGEARTEAPKPRAANDPLLAALELELRTDRELVKTLLERDRKIEQLIAAHRRPN